MFGFLAAVALVEEGCFGLGAPAPAAHVHEEPEELEVQVDGLGADHQVRP